MQPDDDDDVDDDDDDEKARLLTSAKISRSKRLIQETKQISISIAQSLERDSATISSARHKLDDAQDHVDDSRHLLNQIERRRLVQRYFPLVCLSLVFMSAFSIWWWLRTH
jgi:hypothetical protein